MGPRSAQLEKSSSTSSDRYLLALRMRVAELRWEWWDTITWRAGGFLGKLFRRGADGSVSAIRACQDRGKKKKSISKVYFKHLRDESSGGILSALAQWKPGRRGSRSEVAGWARQAAVQPVASRRQFPTCFLLDLRCCRNIVQERKSIFIPTPSFLLSSSFSFTTFSVTGDKLPLLSA